MYNAAVIKKRLKRLNISIADIQKGCNNKMIQQNSHEKQKNELTGGWDI